MGLVRERRRGVIPAPPRPDHHDAGTRGQCAQSPPRRTWPSLFGTPRTAVVAQVFPRAIRRAMGVDVGAGAACIVRGKLEAVMASVGACNNSTSGMVFAHHNNS